MVAVPAWVHAAATTSSSSGGSSSSRLALLCPARVLVPLLRLLPAHAGWWAVCAYGLHALYLTLVGCWLLRAVQRALPPACLLVLHQSGVQHAAGAWL